MAPSLPHSLTRQEAVRDNREPHTPRPAGSAGWRGFRRWRRTRPFWGGLLTALAGLEIFGTTQMSLGGLTFQMGPTGFLSWLIPTILVTCGLLCGSGRSSGSSTRWSPR